MKLRLPHKNVRVALIALGSAILLISCGGRESASDQDAYDKLITHKTDSMMTIESAGGKAKYRFEAPLMERYEYARQPYTEFREGIYIITYNDSTMAVESTLRADYALFLEKQDLWEAKGNVVATNAQGEMLETQQLFWNRKLKLIYSNIDSKITRPTGVTYSQRFESDEEFKNWNVYGVMGWTEFEERERRRKETQAMDDVAAEPGGVGYAADAPMAADSLSAAVPSGGGSVGEVEAVEAEAGPEEEAPDGTGDIAGTPETPETPEASDDDGIVPGATSTDAGPAETQ